MSSAISSQVIPYGAPPDIYPPSNIIEELDLRKPIYKQLAAYGHMGREDLDVKWEKTDKVEALKQA